MLVALSKPESMMMNLFLYSLFQVTATHQKAIPSPKTKYFS
jgi:hypothetical protein